MRAASRLAAALLLLFSLGSVEAFHARDVLQSNWGPTGASGQASATPAADLPPAHPPPTARRRRPASLLQRQPLPPLVRRPMRPALPPQWQLLWADEFEGDALDGSKWEAMEGDGSAFGIPGWGNNELQVYTGRRENLRVEGGMLVIQAQAEPGGDGGPFGQYTSARLRTAGRFAVAPSPRHPVVRIEARIKLEAGDGMWPAFWMLPQDWVYGDWPASGEIDIFEGRNAMDWCLGSLHYGGQGALRTTNGGTAAQLADSWHVYSIEWEAKQLRWYLDGVQYLSVASGNGTRGEGSGSGAGWYSLGAGVDRPDAPFDQPFHLLLNLAVGGSFPWVGAEAVAATLAARPKRMWVDWVRVHGRAAAPA